MKSITDKIYTAMIEEKEEFSNAQILKRFFRINIDDKMMAKKIVEPLLKDDARFKKFSDNTWTPVKVVPIEMLGLNEVPFILFYIEDPKKTHISRLLKDGDIFSVFKEFSSIILYKGGMLDDELQLKEILWNASRYIFIPYDAKSLGFLKKAHRIFSPLQPEFRTLSIKSLIFVLYPDKKLKTWDDIIEAFKIITVESEKPSSKVKTLRSIFEHILGVVVEKGISNFEELFELSLQGRKVVDYSRYGFETDFLRDIPDMSGVYSFLDKSGRVIYVGKTNNLKIRINSYFHNTGESLEKIRGILEQLFTIEYRVLGSDLEALLEEYKLINKYKPPFNRNINIPERKVSIASRVLLLPSGMEDVLKLYFLSDNTPLMEYDLDCSKPDNGVLELLKKMESAQESVFDPLKLIVISYLKRYGERLNSVELDRYSSIEAVVRALYEHCRNPSDITREKSSYMEHI